MNANHSVIDLFMNASIIVQVVMLILLMASVLSWTMIFQKHSFLKKLKTEMKKFEGQFWSGIDMHQFYKVLHPQTVNGTAAIFVAGFKEFLRLRDHGHHLTSEQQLQNIQRAMHVAQSGEEEELESNLPFLATVGSVSPYIGLFGTVWGIMTAFSALGSVEQATIAMVAPGISEALIATAMGLFAAIPAVLAYNRYTAMVEKMAADFENFEEDFSRLLLSQLDTGSHHAFTPPQ
jgi:biopolymer transport protein TolQ